jgi:uncharacterized protein (DUF983 family)
MSAGCPDIVRQEIWDLPSDDRERFLTALQRAFTRRCPYCGGKGIFSSYLALRECCPRCGVRFEREDGYFLGAYAFNLVFSEILGLGLAIYLIFFTVLRDAGLIWQEVIAISLAVIFPIIFFPYSRGVWMAVDVAFHPPASGGEGQLRGALEDASGQPPA